MRQARKSKVQPSQISRAKAKPKKAPGDSYDSRSYAKAISQGVRKADEALRAVEVAEALRTGKEPPGDDVVFVEHWSPHRLRHARATEIRQVYGIESTATMLGDKVNMVDVYAEVDLTRAEKIARECG